MKIQSSLLSLVISMHCISLKPMQDPLLQAIRDKNLENLQAVLQDKNPNYYNNTEHTTPLALACQEGHMPTVQALLASGAQVDFQLTNKAEWPKHPTALTTTALAGNYEMCEFLLAQGAQINPLNPDNFTPLHAAARSGNKHIIKLFIERGANINAQTKQYRTTPLHETIPQIADTGTPKDKGNFHACRLIVQAGANLDLQTRYVTRGTPPRVLNDKTPLMLAAERNKALYIYLLTLYEADAFLIDKDGKTAADLCSLKDQSTLAMLGKFK